MDTIWSFSYRPRGYVDQAPVVAGDMLFAAAGHRIWCHNLRWGYYYFSAPLFSRARRLLYPERGWVRKFLWSRDRLYLTIEDRFGRDSDVVFDPGRCEVIKADTGPLHFEVRYIFASGVRVERCLVDGECREGVTAHDHHNKRLLWTSTDKIRPAIRYTELLGDILSVGDLIVICQNYFARKRHMPAGFSITAFHHRTGSIQWNIESYTYSHRLFPFVVVDDAMYITGGGHNNGFFRKIDLTNGAIVMNHPIKSVDSGVTYHDGVFFFGADGKIMALSEGVS